jgi:HAD superfamily hydrolase (TIGR01509 family)
MPRFDAILTDVDGTLIDSESLGKEAFMVVGREHGLNISSEEFDTTTGWSAKKRFAHFRDAGRFTTGAPEQGLWLKKLAVYAAMNSDKIDVLPGVPGLFRQVSRSGIDIAAVTNSRRATAVTKIGRLGEFARHLRFTITADDVSQPKPDPEGYKLGQARLGLPRSRLVILEDSKAGVEAAHRAGIPCIQIQSDPAEFSDKAALRIDSLGIKRDYDRVMAFMGINHNLDARQHLDRRVTKMAPPFAA